MGPDYILVNLSVDFEDSMTLEEVEDTISSFDQKIKELYPQVKRIFIEAEKIKSYVVEAT